MRTACRRVITAAIDNVTNSRASRLGWYGRTHIRRLASPTTVTEGTSAGIDFDLQFLPAALQPWVGDISDRLAMPSRLRWSLLQSSGWAPDRTSHRDQAANENRLVGVPEHLGRLYRTPWDAEIARHAGGAKAAASA